MQEITRLAFVKRSAVAAAGVTALGALTSEQAEAAARGKGGPFVAYVRDASTGTVSVMAGDRTVEIHDHQLAARIARAGR